MRDGRGAETINGTSHRNRVRADARVNQDSHERGRQAGREDHRGLRESADRAQMGDAVEFGPKRAQDRGRRARVSRGTANR